MKWGVFKRYWHWQLGPPFRSVSFSLSDRFLFTFILFIFFCSIHPKLISCHCLYKNFFWNRLYVLASIQSRVRMKQTHLLRRSFNKWCSLTQALMGFRVACLWIPRLATADVKHFCIYMGWLSHCMGPHRYDVISIHKDALCHTGISLCRIEVQLPEHPWNVEWVITV